MAAVDERLSSIATQQPFDELDRLNAGLKEVVSNIIQLNKTAKGLEFNLKGATDLQQSVSLTNQLVDANGQLVTATNDVTKTLAAAAAVKSTYNGTTKGVLDTQKQLIRLEGEEAKARALSSKAIQEEAKARKELANATVSETRARTQLQNEADKAVRLAAKEAKATKDLSDAYVQLKNQYTEAANKAKTLGAALGANHPEFIAAAADANKLNDVLFGIESAVGQNQRNVGNYKSGFNGLNQSIQQILREAPSAAISLNTFFLAISNNLPIFFDEIQRIKVAQAEANTLLKEQIVIAREAAIAQALNTGATTEAALAQAALAEAALVTKAAQEKAPSILEQIGKSLFSFNSLLTAGVLVLTLFGGKIIDWVSGLFGAAKAQDFLNDALKQGEKDAASEIVSLKNLYDATQNTTLSITQRKSAIDKLQELYPDVFANINQEEFLNGKAKDSYDRLTASIYATAKAKAIENKQTEIIQAGLDKETELRKAAKKAFDDGVKDYNKPIKIARNTGAGDDKAVVYSELSIEQSNKVRAQRSLIADRELADFKKAQDAKLKELQDAGNEQVALIIETNHKKEKAEKDGEPKAKAPHDTTNDKLKAESDLTKALYDQFKLRSEQSAAVQKGIAEDESKSFEERKTAYDNFTFERLNIAGLESAKEQDIIQQKLDKIKDIEAKPEADRTEAESKLLLSKQAFEVALTNVQEAYAVKRQEILNDEVKFQQGIAKKQTDFAEKNLKDMAAGLSNTGGTSSSKSHEKDLKERQKANEIYAGAAIDAATELSKLNDIAAQKRIDAIDAEIAKIKERKQAELDALEASNLSADEKARKAADINARAAALEAAQNQKKRQEQRKQAEIDKAITIAKIIAETALAVVHQLGGGDPYTAIARAVAAGVMGAAQLAVAIATPIPQFADGVESSPEGLAIVGERGRELRINPDGSTELTPGKATLTYLQKGTQIVPAHELMAMAGYYTAMPVMTAGIGMDTLSLERKMTTELRSLGEVIRNKKEVKIDFTGVGMQHLSKVGGSAVRYIHNSH